MTRILLSGSWFKAEHLKKLSEYAQIVDIWDAQKDGTLDLLLPDIDIILTAAWPPQLTKERISRMGDLKMVQCLFAGVDTLPVSILPAHVLLCSNAGAYSQEVAEHAWALVLAASKCITLFSEFSRSQPFFMDRMQETALKMMSLEGKVAGIIGYGGIGSAFGAIAKSFRMRVLGFGRKRSDSEDVELFTGTDGLNRVLSEADVVLLSIPLTKSTKGMISSKQLSIMKERAILVNVARGDLVDREAILDHLLRHSEFWYATDVGWRIDGKETADPTGQFGGVKNYLVTPHVAGVSSQPTGRPSLKAIENVIRFIETGNPHNVVDKSEY